MVFSLLPAHPSETIRRCPEVNRQHKLRAVLAGKDGACHFLCPVLITAFRLFSAVLKVFFFGSFVVSSFDSFFFF